MTAHGDHDMGHTVAGWTGTALAVLGSTLGGAGFALGSPLGLWLGVAVLLAAAVATWLLHLAGWGKPTGPRPAAQRHWRTRDTTARHGHLHCLGCRLAGRRPVAAPAAGSAVGAAPAVGRAVGAAIGAAPAVGAASVAEASRATG